ncbi:MAG TPA: c-type cytochrome [Caulobacteraceae bacterium]|jgi:cytochrome c2|nr:c-type cytochrome [Caulobacteraceae bacterium]
MRRVFALVLALVATPALAQPAGKALFDGNCADCHGLDAASTYTAPTLKGVVGRKIASLGDFNYSDGLKAKAGGTWTDSTLDAFLADPKAFAPGVQMFAAEPDPAKRRAIIDYLKTVK